MPDASGSSSGEVPRQFLILSPAGAGRTTALDAFDDYGFEIHGDVDGSTFLKTSPGLLAGENDVAITLALSEDANPEAVLEDIRLCMKKHPALTILRLDAATDLLVARYKESGKPHPYKNSGDLESAITFERSMFEIFKALKRDFDTRYYSVDTATTNCPELRNKVDKILGMPISSREMTVTLTSFGFKHGLPPDAELVLDMRFVKNPFYDEKLRPLTGLDKPVKDFIDSQPGVQAFAEAWKNLLDLTLPLYVDEGKLRLTMGIGCTGGQHRSVWMTQILANHLKTRHPDYNVVVVHREQGRWPKTANHLS